MLLTVGFKVNLETWLYTTFENTSPKFPSPFYWLNTADSVI
jgi:hypothetical protein